MKVYKGWSRVVSLSPLSLGRRGYGTVEEYIKETKEAEDLRKQYLIETDELERLVESKAANIKLLKTSITSSQDNENSIPSSQALSLTDLSSPESSSFFKL